MCIETLEQQAGPAFIPLAEIPKSYAGAIVGVRLYDAGDVAGTNHISVLSPNMDPKNYISSYTSVPYGLDLSSPWQSGYSPAGATRNATNDNSFLVTAPCTDYNAYDYGPKSPLQSDQSPAGPPPICPALTSFTLHSTGVLSSSNGSNGIANDTWMTFHVPIPTNYDPNDPTQNNPVGNAWWKMYYKLEASSSYPNPSASDTTTWQVISGSSPVHLISEQ
jgi:hypothetical protein